MKSQSDWFQIDSCRFRKFSHIVKNKRTGFWLTNAAMVIFWVVLFDLLSSMEIWHVQASGRRMSPTHASLLASDAFWVRSWAQWDVEGGGLREGSAVWSGPHRCSRSRSMHVFSFLIRQAALQDPALGLVRVTAAVLGICKHSRKEMRSWRAKAICAAKISLPKCPT